ncbi:MAG: hypothetical protein ACREV4_05310 [Gammaproteobacteria bacterium]
MQTQHFEAHSYLGVLLLLAFFAQDLFHLKWPWLAVLQTDETYKQVSGLVLVTFIGYQWYLSVLRAKGLSEEAARHYERHRWAGALAPLFFYLHSHQIGYAYLFLLSTIYFGNVVLGLLHPLILQTNNKHLFNGWMVTHVSIAVFLVTLASYHIFTAFYYS